MTPLEEAFMNELNNPSSPTMKTVDAYMKKCEEKFQKEHPCPKCGSHNVDIDWGTPMFCKNCGEEWYE